MPITTNKGAMAVTVADTTGKGLYAADGSRRVTLVSGVSYVGLHAADSSLNVVLDSEGTGQYHPSGALRGSDKGITGYYTESGGVNMSGLNVPSQLFSASEPGVWYDPSDLTTLYQDKAGTTPVTAPAQPVGLMLSKDQGLVIGPELVTNGTFDTDTSGWNVYNPTYGSISYSAGKMRLTQDIARTGAIATQAITTNVGRMYTYSVDFSPETTTGTNYIYVGTSSGGYQTVNINAGSTVKTYTGTFVATATTHYISVASFQATLAGEYSEWDNISVKLLAGNHATQSTSASRPTYAIVPATGRRNLLTYSEQFDNAAWTKSSATIAANTGISPDGLTTADKFIPNASASGANVSQNSSVAPSTYSFSFYAKAAEQSVISLVSNLTGSFRAIVFNLSTETATPATGWDASITSVGNGWYRCSCSATADTTASKSFQIGNNTTGWTGDGTSGVYLWGAQLELGSTATAYQKVVTVFEVTEAGIPSLSYLSFDGVDDFMVTPTITPGIDKVQVFAGVRKLSDVGCVLAELSVNRNTNNGAWTMNAPAGVAPAQGYGFISKGTINSSLEVNSGFASPITNIVTGLGDIGGDLTTLRVNGSEAATSSTDQGTGNYLAYPMYIGRRGGTTLPFTGQLYGLVVRFGSNLDGDAIARTEKWLGIKTGVTV